LVPGTLNISGVIVDLVKPRRATADAQPCRLNFDRIIISTSF
jgi:hypothetical protein